MRIKIIEHANGLIDLKCGDTVIKIGRMAGMVIKQLTDENIRLTKIMKEGNVNKDSRQFEIAMLKLMPDVEAAIINMINLHRKKSKDAGNKWAKQQDTSILEMFYGGIKRPFTRLQNFVERWMVGSFTDNEVKTDSVLDYLQDIAIYSIMFHVIIKNDHLNMNKAYFKQLIDEYNKNSEAQ